MKKKIIVLTSLLLVLCTLMYLTNKYIVKDNQFFYQKTDITVENYTLYTKESFTEINCDINQSFTVLFEEENKYYTTNQIKMSDSCYSSYFIKHNNRMFDLSNAVTNKIISIEELKSAHLGVDVIERTLFHNSEDVIKVVYQDLTSDTSLEERNLANANEMKDLTDKFETLMFSDKTSSHTEVLFILSFHTIDNVYIYQFKTDQVIETHTGKKASIDDFLDYDYAYYLDYFQGK